MTILEEVEEQNQHVKELWEEANKYRDIEEV